MNSRPQSQYHKQRHHHNSADKDHYTGNVDGAEATDAEIHSAHNYRNKLRTPYTRKSQLSLRRYAKEGLKRDVTRPLVLMVIQR